MAMNEEAIEILQSMKSDFPLPKAAQTRRAQNESLEAAEAWNKRMNDER